MMGEEVQWGRWTILLGDLLTNGLKAYALLGRHEGAGLFLRARDWRGRQPDAS